MLDPETKVGVESFIDGMNIDIELERLTPKDGLCYFCGVEEGVGNISVQTYRKKVQFFSGRREVTSTLSRTVSIPICAGCRKMGAMGYKEKTMGIFLGIGFLLGVVGAISMLIDGENVLAALGGILAGVLFFGALPLIVTEWIVKRVRVRKYAKEHGLKHHFYDVDSYPPLEFLLSIDFLKGTP